MPISATTRARRPRRSVPRPVECLRAGRRRSQVLRRATATCGGSVARARRVGRGRVGVVHRWYLDTPSASMPTRSVLRAAMRPRSVPRPVGCLRAGRHRDRRRFRRHPTSGGSAARARRVAPGPIGAAPPSCPPTPSVGMPIGCTRRARRLLRSAPRPVGCPPAGRRRGRHPTPMRAMNGASAARGRRAGRGLIGAAPPSSRHGPRLRAHTATASNGSVPCMRRIFIP